MINERKELIVLLQGLVRYCNGYTPSYHMYENMTYEEVRSIVLDMIQIAKKMMEPTS